MISNKVWLFHASVETMNGLTLCLVLLLFVLTTRQSGADSDDSFPAAHSSTNKVLSMVVAYSLTRLDPFMHILRGHQSMCEGGWDVTFVIFTAHKVSNRMKRYLESKMYCFRIERPISLVISQHDPSVGINLVEETKDYMRKAWTQYDVTMYMEDDVLVDYTHLVGYLAETRKLRALVGKEEAANKYYVGFQRYRRHLIPFEKNKVKMTEEHVIHQEYLEEIPFFKPICIKDQPYMQAIGLKRTPAANVYQAMWILTKEQIGALQTKCNFLDQTYRGTAYQRTGYVREYLGSLSLLENDVLSPNCGLQKVIPAGRLPDFAIMHYYYSTNVLLLHDSHPVFTVHEHIQAGMLQMATPEAYAGYFDDQRCWAPIIAKQRALMNVSLSDDSTSVLSFQGKTAVLQKGVKHAVHSDEVLKKHGYDTLEVHSMKHVMYDYLPQGEDLQ